MKNLSKNLKLIVDIESGGNIHRFSNDYLEEERSDKLRAWIKGTRDPNLGEIDKVVESIKRKVGKELSLDWLVYDKGEMFVEYDQLKEEKRIIQEELSKVLEEYGAFKKMALANFHNVDSNNQFVDNDNVIFMPKKSVTNFTLFQDYFVDLLRSN